MLAKRYPLLMDSNAFKMVALGSLGDDFTPTTSDLRDHARWLLDVPNEALSLNASSFPAITRHPLRKYQPLTMLLYGGLHGAHLSKLTGISVWFGEDAQILGIDFSYSVEVDGCKIHTLGLPFSGRKVRSEPCNCCKCTDDDRSTDDCSTDYRIEFPIDGPGGEVINRVDLQHMGDEGILGFRVRLVPRLRRLECLILTDTI